MCDHCAKVTDQKGYSGQVTCRCENPDKKVEQKVKEKEFGGCCNKKPKESAGGCCKPACCSDGRKESDASQSKKENGGGCCKGRK